MRKHRLSLIFIVLSVLGGSAVLAFQNRDQPDRVQKQEDIDVNQFPIVDYSSPLPSDPGERAKRRTKSKKYNGGKHTPALAESSNQIFYISDWDAGLPALPFAQSVAVVIGEITQADAHLSEDLTDIYSEFSIRVGEVLKNDLANPISSGDSITVQRKGGCVRFPSGKIAVSIVNHQDMPRIGKRYVLFLTHSTPMGEQIDSFYILTGYLLRGGNVFPLDKTSSRHPISAYKGTDEEIFMRDLRAAIVKSPLGY